MKFAPVAVGRNHIPNPAKSANMTTSLSQMERRLSLRAVFDRTQYLSRHKAIRAHGRRSKAYTLRPIPESLATARRHNDAAFYAHEALRTHPSVWAPILRWRVPDSIPPLQER